MTALKRLAAFLSLVRWPNLVFIALTQLLFFRSVFVPLYGNQSYGRLCWLVIASVFIAAAGYVINDYFDLNIDQVNKPGKNVFVKHINRRWAIVWHFILSFMGVVATALAVGLKHWYLVLANIICILLLWLYSTSLKRRLLIGNLVISILTAWTVLIVFFAYTEPADAFMANNTSIKFFRITFLYAGFAFLISLIREAIKDMEDLEGDARYGCKTLPIVAGIRSTKIYTGIFMAVLAAALMILQLYVIQFGWWFAVLYSIVFVIFPLLYGMKKLYRASSARDFSELSRLTKMIMFTGILSMVFFLFYF